MKETIIIDNDLFSYPTKKEKQLCNSDFPVLTAFNIEDVDEINQVLSGLSGELIMQRNHFSEWNRVLINKLGFLHNSYVNAKTYYIRKEKLDSSNKDNYFLEAQFWFYAETFYYFFLSSKDLLLQLINIAYKLGIDEGDVKWYKVYKKIEKIDTVLGRFMFDFNEKVSDAKEFRNSFTHRFPRSEYDYRIEKEDRNNITSYKIGCKKTIELSLLLQDMKSSTNHLSNFIKKTERIIINNLKQEKDE